MLKIIVENVEKQLGKKVMVNFKIYDVTDWATNDYNTHTTQYFRKQRQSDNLKTR